ncbi:MAG: hypothetical protein E7035_02340 [Verrucomicrobiaceae bacterium]|nr:hypothetical protein [Verrucomicrobiaceae bacterium]
MKKYFKSLLLFFGAVPLACKMPYLIGSWQSSPFEKYDAYIWLFMPLFILVCEFVRRVVKIELAKEAVRKKIVVSLLIIFSVAFVLLGFSLNALGLVLALSILLLALELSFGRNVVLAQIPTILFVLLTIPNLSFWISYCFNVSLGGLMSFFLYKILFGILFMIVWIVRTLQTKRYPKARSIIFVVVVVVISIFAEMRTRDIPNGDSFCIDSSKMKSGDWLGTRNVQTADDKRFFPHAKKIVRKIYYNKTSNLSLLEIEVGDTSDIHPVEICLRSSGALVKSTRQIYLEVNGKKIQVNEIFFKNNEQLFVSYSFFSNGKISTGYFTKFRLSANDNNWRHYQIVTPVDKSEIEIRNRIKDFLHQMM